VEKQKKKKKKRQRQQRSALPFEGSNFQKKKKRKQNAVGFLVLSQAMLNRLND